MSVGAAERNVLLAVQLAVQLFQLGNDSKGDGLGGHARIHVHERDACGRVVVGGYDKCAGIQPGVDARGVLLRVGVALYRVNRALGMGDA